MAQITTLKDKTGTTLYPVTSAQAVIDHDGIDLQTRLHLKQDTLTTAPGGDIALSPDGLLSLTDMAKKRLFIDLWNEACGIWGSYNEDTGFFELNTLTDITYQEALSIYNFGPLIGDYQTVYGPTKMLRTYLPRVRTSNTSYKKETYTFSTSFDYGSTVVNLNPYDKNEELYWASSTSIYSFGDYCFSAIKYIGIVNVTEVNNLLYQAGGVSRTEELHIKAIHTNCDFRAFGSLKLECWKYMIDNATNTQPITITVRPDVYAKLTDPDNTEWHQLMLDAAAKNIQFATV